MAVLRGRNFLGERVVIILTASFFTFLPHQENRLSERTALHESRAEDPRLDIFPKESSKIVGNVENLMLHSGGGFRCFAVDRKGVVAPILCPRKPKLPVKA